MIEEDDNKDTSQMQSQQVEAQEAPQIMFQYWTDPVTGQVGCQMFPDWYNYFCQFLLHIQDLQQTINKNWKKQQQDAYLLFLNDLKNYIYSYVFTGQVNDYNLFIKAMEAYGENNNKLGYELYNRQNEYLQKKLSGHDFNLDKKKKKQANKKTQEVKQKPKQQKQKQEQVIVRKDDPTITANQLRAKEWQPNKYANMESFHLESANLIFIGHVDSGKSTLTGNIMKELKLVDEQELTRNKQQAKQKHMQTWQLAFIADVDPNQRAKGKTVECSKLMFSLQNRRFTLFDAPGHKNYVPSMIMGACQADIAILIISSKEGEFQSGFEKEGQTKEHAMLAKALGVQTMIAVVTKMGTVEWSQTRFNHIKSQVAPFLQNSCGFSGVTFIPIDSINNQNIHSRVTNVPWYKGQSLIEILDVVKIPARDPDGPLRIPIIDKFKDVGQFFVYGKVQSGKIALENQVVSLLPSRQYVCIKEIYNAKDQKLPYALAGQNVKLRIKGIDEDKIHRGDILCSNNNFCQQSNEFKANLTVLELPEQKKIMSSGYQCVMHMHAISEECQISAIEAKVQKGTGKLLKATYLLPGEVGRVTVKPKKPVCLQKFDFMQSLGRFTLRDQGKTIGFGEVLKIKPAKNLTKQQKDQLGIKTAEGEGVANLNAQLEKVNLEQKKN